MTKDDGIHVNPQIGARLPTKDVEMIEYLVREGYFTSASDFVRQAVAFKLDQHRLYLDKKKEVSV